MDSVTSSSEDFSILISGSTLPASIETIYLNGLRLTSCSDVQIISTDDLYKNQTTFYKITRRLLPNSHNRIRAYNHSLLEGIKKKKRGDVLLVFKGMEVLPATLEQAKAAGLFLVNYNPDHPYIFSGRGSGNENVRNGIKYFDLYLTYAWDAKDALKKQNIQSELIPFGFENSAWMENDLLENEEIKACCFLGNPDPTRIEFLQEFSKTIPLHLFGTGWFQGDFNNEVKIHNAVTGIEFYETLRKYRIQLNLMRPHNLNSHNMRTFDIAGCGGIGLMPKTKDHLQFFSDTKEIFLYRGLSHAQGTAKHILKLDYQEASKIRKAARQRALLLKADYNSRSRQIFNAIVRGRSKEK